MRRMQLSDLVAFLAAQSNDKKKEFWDGVLVVGVTSAHVELVEFWEMSQLEAIVLEATSFITEANSYGETRFYSDGGIGAIATDLASVFPQNFVFRGLGQSTKQCVETVSRSGKVYESVRPLPVVRAAYFIFDPNENPLMGGVKDGQVWTAKES